MTADWIFKTVVIGSPNVGKTSFVKGTIQNYEWFDNSPSFSIGVDFEVFNCKLESNDRCKLILWDLKSRTRFLELFPYYFNGTCGIFLCFDVSNHQSFEDLHIWVRYIKSLLLEDVPIIIVGIKSDLGLSVDTEEIEDFMTHYGIDSIFFASHQTRFKKDIIMKQMAKKIILKHKIPSNELNSRVIENFTPVGKNTNKNKLISHINQVKREMKFDINIETENLRQILIREELKLKKEHKSLTTEERKAYKKFAEFFSVCPICSATNHESYLKRFYFSSDPLSRKLRKMLLDLIDKSKLFPEIYYNEIKVGVPILYFLYG
ncbi:MAG: Rab family GTPase [Promethearchaeota archaeon]